MTPSSGGRNINAKALIGAASLAAQGVFFVGFVWMLADMVSLVTFAIPESKQNPSLLLPYIRETFESYLPTLGTGVAGAVTSWLIYRKSDFRSSWYLNGTRILGWLWLPLIPVGTLIGIALLRARKLAIESAAGRQPDSSR